MSVFEPVRDGVVSMLRQPYWFASSGWVLLAPCTAASLIALARFEMVQRSPKMLLSLSEMIEVLQPKSGMVAYK